MSLNLILNKGFLPTVFAFFLFHSVWSQSLELVTPQNRPTSKNAVEVLGGKVLALHDYTSSEVEFLLADGLYTLYRKNFNCGKVFYVLNSPSHDNEIILLTERKIIFWNVLQRRMVKELMEVDLSTKWGGPEDIGFSFFTIEGVSVSDKNYLAVTCGKNGIFMVLDVSDRIFVYTGMHEIGIHSPSWNQNLKSLTFFAGGDYWAWDFQTKMLQRNLSDISFRDYSIYSNDANYSPVYFDDTLKYQLMRKKGLANMSQFILLDRNEERRVGDVELEFDRAKALNGIQSFYTSNQLHLSTYVTRDSLLFLTKNNKGLACALKKLQSIKGINWIVNKGDTLMVIQGQKVLEIESTVHFQNVYYVTVEKLNQGHWNRVSLDSIVGNQFYSVNFIESSNKILFNNPEGIFYWSLTDGFEASKKSKSYFGIKNVFLQKSDELHFISFEKSKQTKGLFNHYFKFDGMWIERLDSEGEELHLIKRNWGDTSMIMQRIYDSLVPYHLDRNENLLNRKIGNNDSPGNLSNSFGIDVRAKYDKEEKIFVLSSGQEKALSKIGKRFIGKGPRSSYFRHPPKEDPHFFLDRSLNG